MTSVLVPLDGSDLAEELLPGASALARPRPGLSAMRPPDSEHRTHHQRSNR